MPSVLESLKSRIFGSPADKDAAWIIKQMNSDNRLLFGQVLEELFQEEGVKMPRMLNSTPCLIAYGFLLAEFEVRWPKHPKLKQLVEVAMRTASSGRRYSSNRSAFKLDGSASSPDLTSEDAPNAQGLLIAMIYEVSRVRSSLTKKQLQDALREIRPEATEILILAVGAINPALLQFVTDQEKWPSQLLRVCCGHCLTAYSSFDCDRFMSPHPALACVTASSPRPTERVIDATVVTEPNSSGKDVVGSPTNEVLAVVMETLRRDFTFARKVAVRGWSLLCSAGISVITWARPRIQAAVVAIKARR